MSNPFANKRTTTPPPAAAANSAAAPSFSSAPGPDTGADPFAAPAGPGSGDKITDFEGYLLLVKPTEIIDEMETKLGKTEAIRADVVVLDHEDGPIESDGVLVFQIALKRDLKRTIEGPTPYLLGRLGKGEARAGKSAPFIFNQPTDDDKNVARKYLAAAK